jgi:hypothetical protein
VPRKSGPFDTLMVLSKVEGHTRNTDLTIILHGSGCPDLSGPAGALCRGHETKKDTSMPMCLTKGDYFASSKSQE